MEIESKSALSHQRAPVEVWESILDWATHLPKELGVAEWTGDYDPLEMGRSYVPRFAASPPSVRTEIKNRYNLSLVSHSWNETMLGTLYKSIYINNLVQLRQVHQLITTRPNITPLIRRIDVGNINRNEYDDAYILLNEIFDVCPNLVYLKAARSKTGYFISHFIAYLHRESSRSDHSIQQLEYHHGPALPLSFITFSNIRALLLSGYILDHIREEALSLPRLEILAVPQFTGRYDRANAYFSKCRFPRLHSLIVGSDWSAAGPVVKKYGPLLQTLHVVESARIWSGFNHANNIIIEPVHFCVRLEQLIIPAAWTNEEILSKFSLLTSIRLLELTYADGNARSSPSNYFLQNKLTNIFPNIQSLRISGIPTPTSVWNDEVAGLHCWIDYMDTYEDFMHSNGINMEILTEYEQIIRSKEEFKGYYEQLKADQPPPLKLTGPLLG